MGIRVLITGITGQIGTYVKEVFESDINYDVWGISRTKTSNNKIKELDLRDKINLERFILELQPNIIIHLAGISNLEECALDPINAIVINGHVTVNICEIIHKNNLDCKLFNASSSEIYKGHNIYTIKEDDTFYMPNHPYGISKLVAHNMVDYFRVVHKQHFSNGIIFTTESHRRTPAFLFKKIANHIKSWKNGNREPITVGCLKSYRTLLHASDVAHAIKCIIEQNKGDNYLICGDDHTSVEDIISRMFELAGMAVSISDTEIRSVETADLIVKIGGSLRGANSSIHGNCQKIKQLGWCQMYDLDAICNDHLS